MVPQLATSELVVRFLHDNKQDEGLVEIEVRVRYRRRHIIEIAHLRSSSSSSLLLLLLLPSTPSWFCGRSNIVRGVTASSRPREDWIHALAHAPHMEEGVVHSAQPHALQVPLAHGTVTARELRCRYSAVRIVHSFIHLFVRSIIEPNADRQVLLPQCRREANRVEGAQQEAQQGPRDRSAVGLYCDRQQEQAAHVCVRIARRDGGT